MPHGRPLGRRWAALALGLLATVTTACGTGSADDAAGEPGDGVTVRHAQGTETLDGTPERVVVFDLGVLETLDTLDVDVVGVPEVAAMPEHLSSYTSDEYTTVGSLKEPDYEQVNALEPDLVIVAGRSAPAYGELSEIAPTIDMTVDTGDFLNSATERVRALGTLFGKEERVTDRLDALRESAAEVRGSVPDGKTGLVVLTTGGKMSAYGPGSRFGLVYDDLGVAPAVPDLSADVHGDAISAEFLAEADPDLLYVVDRDSAIGENGEAARELLDNALVNGTTAARNDDIVYLDPATWYLTSTGLVSLESMVGTVGDSLA
ncbi:siderophore ABC transporter substrate-binding protein [Saccharomonospora iraqiensis]|uniref:siderophore ABC transporter substrate-binding protein n=1 Tax=Saccharomonospora iraqiensis TaxID=52698 RepID=UPI0003F5B6D3|nr:siderophore ABC transporter substrate-binding protein [Saccharomonospora iraqiensis]